MAVVLGGDTPSISSNRESEDCVWDVDLDAGRASLAMSVARERKVARGIVMPRVFWRRSWMLRTEERDIGSDTWVSFGGVGRADVDAGGSAGAAVAADLACDSVGVCLTLILLKSKCASWEIWAERLEE